MKKINVMILQDGKFPAKRETKEFNSYMEFHTFCMNSKIGKFYDLHGIEYIVCIERT